MKRMNRKRRLVAAALGAIAAVLAAVHGFYEIQQGSRAPPSIFINAIGGTECEPSCLPAMTLLPTYDTAGITTLPEGAVMAFWITLRLGKPRGPAGLLVLSVILPVTGGGYVPPIIGIAGVLAARVRGVPP